MKTDNKIMVFAALALMMVVSVFTVTAIDTDATDSETVKIYLYTSTDAEEPELEVEVFKNNFVSNYGSTWPEYTDDGYIIGWYYDKDFKDRFYYNTTFSKDTNLYAKIVDTTNYYTIALIADDFNVYEVVTVKHGKKVTSLPTPTKSGYTFSGWYYSEPEVDAETGMEKYVKFSTDDAIEDDLVLIAGFEKSVFHMGDAAVIGLLIVMIIMFIVAYTTSSIKIGLIGVTMGIVAGAMHFGMFDALVDYFKGLLEAHP